MASGSVIGTTAFSKRVKQHKIAGCAKAENSNVDFKPRQAPPPALWVFMLYPRVIGGHLNCDSNFREASAPTAQWLEKPFIVQCSMKSKQMQFGINLAIEFRR